MRLEWSLQNSWGYNAPNAAQSSQADPWMIKELSTLTRIHLDILASSLLAPITQIACLESPWLPRQNTWLENFHSTKADYSQCQTLLSAGNAGGVWVSLLLSSCWVLPGWNSFIGFNPILKSSTLMIPFLSKSPHWRLAISIWIWGERQKYSDPTTYKCERQWNLNALCMFQALVSSKRKWLSRADNAWCHEERMNCAVNLSLS